MSDSAQISLAYSVDADDAFMFHALRHARIDTEGLAFSHRRDHTAALNQLAGEGGADVVAVSLGAYPALAREYQLLPHGASVGRGFGPVVVARRPMSTAELAGARVGIPGRSTTAWLVLRLIQPRAEGIEIPIFPFARIFEALEAGEVDAALLIHEGRLIYPERGLHKVVDLGEWWQAEAGLPLPLGVNVIRRALGPAQVTRVSRVLRASIAWALANRGEIIQLLAKEDRGEKSLSKPELIDHYLNLYANQDTAAIADDAKRAVDELFARARAAGLLPADVSADWSD
ncbi:MAG TPA: MqnA/MqnD/SBP family protein [Polyangia bacterium]|jgi:1,4-dihydroxy-6-naphthoate synthase|nr:MqnA/MqnD/SBP family protein [Polyangia bacterium]